MRMIVPAVALVAVLSTAGVAAASDLIHRPINPSFGGDPLNGNWLASQATAQSPGGGSPGFSIDFPDFGGIPQPPPTPVPVPDVPVVEP